MILLGDVGHVESCFCLLGDVVSAGQDWCTVCAKRTIGSEIFLDHPMVLLDDEAQVEARFGPFGDSAGFDAR
jgi:hypothetical protein